jgi:multifunctional methyltransferase subunit TRM112
VERTESEFRVDVMVNMLPKLEWSVLCEAARDVGFEGLPDDVQADAAENEEFLQVLHSCIIDTHVIEGELVSQTGRRYPINDSIPNMLLQDVRPCTPPPPSHLAPPHVTTTTLIGRVLIVALRLPSWSADMMLTKT